MRPSTVYRAAAVIYAAAVFVLSLMPNSGAQGFAWDKANHFIAYAVMSYLFIRAALPGRPFFMAAAGVFLAALVFGAGVEFFQSFTPTRHADFRDVLANAAGSAFGLAVFWFFKNRTEVKRC